MSTVDLPDPRIGTLSRLAPKPVKFVLNWGRRYSLWVFNFGLACCAIEFIATSMSRHDFIRLGVIPFAPGPRQADLMVVSGTVSDKMAPAVRRLYDQMPEPKYVISFGACSNCGGPYWDSYCVTKGVDQIIPVDVYVPGCPPRPEALLHGIIRLQEKIAAESLGERYTNGGDPAVPPRPQPLSPTVLRRPPIPPPPPPPTPIAPDALLESADAPTESFPPIAKPPEQEGPPGSERQPGSEGLSEAHEASPHGQTAPLPPLPESAVPPSPAPETSETGETAPLPVVQEAPQDGTAPLPVVEPDAGEDDRTTMGLPVISEEPDERRNGLLDRLRRRNGGARDEGEVDPSIIPGFGDDSR